MTLFIAWLLIDSMHLDGGWKVWALILWCMHVIYHASPGKDTIASSVVEKLRGSYGRR